MAAKAGGSLRPWPTSRGPGYEIGRVQRGRHSAEAMLTSAAGEASNLCWLGRAGGVLLSWIGWGLLLGPASYLASWIPLVSGLVGCLLGTFALLTGLSQACLVIAVAWVAHRPAVAASLVVVAVSLFFFGGVALNGRRRRQPPPAEYEPVPAAEPRFEHVD